MATVKSFSHSRREYASAGPRPNRYSNQQAKPGSDISDAFSSLAGAPILELPQRYSELKKELVPGLRDQEVLLKNWNEVLDCLKHTNARIKEQGGKIIPRLLFSDIENGRIDPDILEQVRSVGTVIVKGAVTKEQALGWKESIKRYAADNRDRARGFPKDDPQVWEFYHSRPQVSARTHPAILKTQAFLLTQWRADADAEISLGNPISYFDRLRIRFPGDMTFALGPHIDGGSVERWEDNTYRKCFSRILSPNWKSHDAFDATHRIEAKMDIYAGPSACNVFRPWQGWVSMSSTSANEGTLQVYPNTLLSTAYLILRAFFSPIRTASEFGGNKNGYLAAENWALDLESTAFPGSVPGRAQELSDETHPHLELTETMTSVPPVDPGDQVYWHCDTIHAVESQHRGKGDSSVMYIPAVPVTVNNAEYLAAQRASFITGYRPYDFSSVEGEIGFIGRGSLQDINEGSLSRRAYGLEKFEALGNGNGEANAIEKANEWLFGPHSL
ncbi:DUF1479-domain-containing protein [Cantharellus anzutake]|uniref:DUF1479-domain-containing protein n=1 Tax=Cantharellus anzutake TaxID=1750568 RepID=UPI0019037FB3|nr:DUF1479-domain-containing protein [Cantharellus anzutake]KAF8331466.1 DUF1479-domain-containing protein [Cantharellus anzutake]